MKYPTRARILDVTGEVWNGIGIRTPDQSRPHIGKEGLAEEVMWHPGTADVRITLDDGTVLWGWECWWEPIDSVPLTITTDAEGFITEIVEGDHA